MIMDDKKFPRNWRLPPPFDNSRKQKSSDSAHLSDSSHCALLSQKSELNLSSSFFLFLWNGGGENRTLVLSKFHNNAYMLIALSNSASLAVRHPTRDYTHLFSSRVPALEIERMSTHTKNPAIDPQTLGPVRGYRLLDRRVRS